MSNKDALKLLAVFWMFLITFFTIAACVYCSIFIEGRANVGLGLLGGAFFLCSCGFTDDLIRK